MGTTQTRSRRRRCPYSAPVLLAAILVAPVACGSEDPAPLTREQFVQAYVELRLAEREADDDADFQARREEILARHDASEEDLMAFVDAHAHDAGFLAGVWDSVQARLERATDGPPSVPEEDEP